MINNNYIMNYYFNTTLNGNFNQVIEKTTNELRKKGFDVLTEIDMKSTLKDKLDVDLYNYKILGVCNPSFAYVALSAEDKIGTLLPCNVIIQEKELGKVEVSATNPLASMQAVNEIDLEYIAWQIRDSLESVIQNIH